MRGSVASIDLHEREQAERAHLAIGFRENEFFFPYRERKGFEVSPS